MTATALVFLVWGALPPNQLQTYETHYASHIHIHQQDGSGVCGELTDVYERGCARRPGTGALCLRIHGGMGYADGSCGVSFTLDDRDEVLEAQGKWGNTDPWSISFGGPAADQLFEAIRVATATESDVVATASGLAKCQREQHGVVCSIRSHL